jgi:hypothetical protein
MKHTLTVKSAIVIASTLMAPIAIPSSALAGPFGTSETRQWNVCDWERIPEHVVTRITKRADYDEILRRMFNVCPDSALGLTDRPTASVTSYSSDEPGDKSDGRPGNDGNNGNAGNSGPGTSTNGGTSTSSNGGDEGFGLPG